ncbi:hypothetical protein Ddye_020728 [Dipteronia dyeriana]|uniref:Uncharacterized protein n=1 Tax=Dipteronia dyeriana TaxID=168575 RepID=A0AAD9U133_9ROSI|nr:hypothetical protein Ddye_020728 [Dipteronia dyeriana]
MIMYKRLRKNQRIQMSEHECQAKNVNVSGAENLLKTWYVAQTMNEVLASCGELEDFEKSCSRHYLGGMRSLFQVQYIHNLLLHQIQLPGTNDDEMWFAMRNTKRALHLSTEDDAVHDNIVRDHACHFEATTTTEAVPTSDLQAVLSTETSLNTEIAPSTSQPSPPLYDIDTLLPLAPFDPTEVARERLLSKSLRSPYMDPFKEQKNQEVIKQYTAFMSDPGLLFCSIGIDASVLHFFRELEDPTEWLGNEHVDAYLNLLCKRKLVIA